MNDNDFSQEIKIAKEHRKKANWKKIASVLSIAVVLCTAYLLMQPGTAMQNDAVCGLNEHQHMDACYETVKICGYGEDTDQAGDEVVVEGEEGQETHIHTDLCFNKVLVCKEEEHKHTDECFEATEEEQEDVAEEKQEEVQEKTEINQTITAKKDDFTVKVKGTLPEGGSVKLKKMTDKKIEKAIDGEDVEIDDVFFAYDIMIVDSEGTEWEPDNCPVAVTIKNEDIEKDDDIEFIHIKDDGTKEIIDDVKTSDGTVKFEAESFSFYVGEWGDWPKYKEYKMCENGWNGFNVGYSISNWHTDDYYQFIVDLTQYNSCLSAASVIDNSGEYTLDHARKKFDVVYTWDLTDSNNVYYWAVFTAFGNGKKELEVRDNDNGTALEDDELQIKTNWGGTNNSYKLGYHVSLYPVNIPIASDASPFVKSVTQKSMVSLGKATRNVVVALDNEDGERHTVQNNVCFPTRNSMSASDINVTPAAGYTLNSIGIEGSTYVIHLATKPVQVKVVYRFKDKNGKVAKMFESGGTDNELYSKLGAMEIKDNNIGKADGWVRNVNGNKSQITLKDYPRRYAVIDYSLRDDVFLNYNGTDKYNAEYPALLGREFDYDSYNNITNPWYEFDKLSIVKDGTSGSAATVSYANDIAKEAKQAKVTIGTADTTIYVDYTVRRPYDDPLNVNAYEGIPSTKTFMQNYKSEKTGEQFADAMNIEGFKNSDYLKNGMYHIVKGGSLADSTYNILVKNGKRYGFRKAGIGLDFNALNRVHYMASSQKWFYTYEMPIKYFSLKEWKWKTYYQTMGPFDVPFDSGRVNFVYADLSDDFYAYLQFSGNPDTILTPGIVKLDAANKVEEGKYGVVLPTVDDMVGEDMAKDGWTRSGNTLYHNGVKFLGWKDPLTGKIYQPSTGHTESTAVIYDGFTKADKGKTKRLVAQWDVTKGDVIFFYGYDKNGNGDYSDDIFATVKDVPVNTTVSEAMLKAVSANGKTSTDTYTSGGKKMKFAGWYEDIDYSYAFKLGTGGTAITGHPTYVFAKYEETTGYTVTFEAGDGGKLTGTTTITGVDEGTKVSDLTKPTAVPDSGYKFDKWTIGGKDISADATITGDTTIKANFVKSYPAYDLTVTNKLAGVSNSDKFLFELTVLGSDGNAFDFTGITLPSGVTLKSKNVLCFSLADKGSVKLEGIIPQNAKLTLKETNPEGYTVTMDTDKVHYSGDTQDFTLASDLKIDVTNSAGAVLPMTGGTGTDKFTILGLVIMAMAAISVWLIQRRPGRRAGY